MPSIAAFVLALSAVALVDGAARVEDGVGNSHQGSARAPRLGQATSAVSVGVAERQLLPHPPHHHDSSSYSGCLGMTEEELEQAWKFASEAPPCTILVQGVVVAGDDGSGGSSSSGGSGGSGTGGSGSEGGSGDGDGSSGSGGESSGSDGSSSGSSSTGGSGSSGGGDGSGGSSGSGGDSSGSGGSGSSSGSGSGSDSSGSSGGNGSGGSSNGGSSATSGSNGSGGSSGGGGGEDDDGSSAILRYFNISDCDSYSNIWVWDLALSCENSTSLASCECTSASILHDEGDLECPDTASGAPSCPEDCPVCSTCMSLLGPEMGCSDGTIQNDRSVGLEQAATRAFPVAIAVAVAVVALLSAKIGTALYQNRQSDVDGGLGAGFMAEEPPVNAIL